MTSTTFVNIAKMSTATTGTGTMTLGSAVSGYVSFATAGIADGNVVSYTIVDGAAKEVGTGTYTASGTTLSRTLVLSTTGSLLNLSGSATVEVVVAAADMPITGSWTPGIAFGGGATGVTYSNQVGRYWKMGKTVIAWGSFALSAKGSSTGPLTVTGLPFTTDTTSNFNQAADIGIFFNNANSPAVGAMYAFAGPNTTVIGFWASSVQITDTAASANTQIYVSITYQSST